ncbi:hypothetical protein GCM10022222_51900 [Amycolatopsis ultiminotia]|uniref:Uncharacterized protein n=1 Tax=Amycolatopsis ultiminotia TaxID=543629 RepID=A0ABP6X5C5_9PSEU
MLSDRLSTILQRADELLYVQEFVTGLEECKRICEFFSYCQGRMPETGSSSTALSLQRRPSTAATPFRLRS